MSPVLSVTSSSGHDYKAALSDYVKVGGPIAMVPRQAMGIWWTRWFDFNNWDVNKSMCTVPSASAHVGANMAYDIACFAQSLMTMSPVAYHSMFLC